MTGQIIFPSEVRRALLADHARIRRLLDGLEGLAERLQSGEAEVARGLCALAGQLRRALEAHNDSEEQHLAPYLTTVDSWGVMRVDLMLTEHEEEHEQLLAALDGVDAETLARGVPSLAVQLRSHMQREEQTFLSSELIRDDIITSGGPTS